ncbi:uncharacterized protein [Paramormyrops kingsleyae]|uniref:uncharacterized protein isoform X1 n=2 Tax=Paramormyrops kingsleyae TaxID=1676925 RepID=UPI003B96A4BF
MHYCEKGISSGRSPASHKKLVVLSSYLFAMVWNTHIKVMYTRAVWREGDREEEGVVPDNWINRKKKTVRWPRKMSTTKTEKAIRDKENPQDDWMTFSLIKIKISSDKRRECDTYNLTSQAEEEDNEEVIRSTRKRTKKGIPEGFVTNELTDEEGVRGVKLPTFPTAPKKLQHIDSNMLHNTSSENEAMSVQAEHVDNLQGGEMSTPHASTSPQRRDLSTPRSQHAARGRVRDDYRSRSSRGSNIRSRHSDISRNRSRSKSCHSDGSSHTNISRNRSRSKSCHSDGSSHTNISRNRSRSKSCHSDGSSHTNISRNRSRSKSKSWHSDGSSHTIRSRHDGSRHREVRAGHDRSYHSDASRCDDQFSNDVSGPLARSRHGERSRYSDLSSPPYARPSHDAVTESGRWTFPLPWDVYQKKVLNLLVDIRHRLKETQPASSAVHIRRIDTMEDFELQEQQLSDAQAFNTLVRQISKIGGRNTKDCVHKVLDRLFTNSLMAKF